jgi:hypothetical protein
MVASPRLSLAGPLAAKFTADPTRWLLKARSPLVKFRTAVDLLGWPPAAEQAAEWWRRRYEDADLGAVAAAQAADGLWRAPGRLFERKGSLYSPRYRAAVWQLSVLADMRLTSAEGVVARAADAFLARRCGDGFFELGPGGPFVFANAVVASSLAALGVPAAELAPARKWLAGCRREDGGWADPRELPTPASASATPTTAEVLRALASGPAEGEPAAAIGKGRAFLLANLFSDNNGRFAATAAAWRRLSWPQYRYDALSVATALRAAGAGVADVAPLAAAVRRLECRRGFWRQQVALAEEYWLTPVRAGRASRWITYKAALFLMDYYGGGGRAESDCHT